MSDKKENLFDIEYSLEDNVDGEGPLFDDDDVDVEGLISQIESCPNQDEQFLIATEALGILKRRNETNQKNLSEVEKQRNKDIEARVAEVLDILNKKTVKGPSPTDETRLIETQPSIESRGDTTSVCDERILAKILETESPTAVKRTPLSFEAPKAPEKSLSEKPMSSGEIEIINIANDPNGDSMATLIATEILKRVDANATADTILRDPFEEEDTDVIEKFKKKTEAIMNMSFMNERNAEDFFRMFVFECQNRTQGIKELKKSLKILKITFHDLNIQEKELFFDLLTRVVEKPGKDCFVAENASKDSKLSSWNEEISEILSKFLLKLKKHDVLLEKISYLSNFDPYFALKTASLSEDFEEVYEDVVSKILILFPKKRQFKTFYNELNRLEDENKDAQREALVRTIEAQDAQLWAKIELELLKYNAEQKRKIVRLNLQNLENTKLIYPPSPEELQTQIKEYLAIKKAEELEKIRQVDEEKKAKRQNSFINRNKKKLLVSSLLLSLLGVGFGTGLFSKKRSPDSASLSEKNKVLANDYDQDILVSRSQNGALIGIKGSFQTEEELLDNLLAKDINNSAIAGIIGLEKSPLDTSSAEDALLTASALGAGGINLEEKQDSSFVEAERLEKWNYKVKDGDTFFGVVNNWRKHHSFSEIQSKYSFLSGLDNWDLAVALRSIFNRNNGRSRDLDIYKGSGRDIQDIFTGSVYEVFMEIYKFNKRSDRNMVIKFMEDGGDFEVILEKIARGEIGIERKRGFDKKYESMRNKYNKRRGRVSDVSMAEILIDNAFKFASEKGRKFVMQSLELGKTIAEVIDIIEAGYHIDENGHAYCTRASLKDDTGKRKTAKLETEFGTVKGKKAIKAFEAGMAYARDVSQRNNAESSESNNEYTKKSRYMKETEFGTIRGKKAIEAFERGLSSANQTRIDNEWFEIAKSFEEKEAIDMEWEKILENIETILEDGALIVSKTKNDALNVIEG